MSSIKFVKKLHIKLKFEDRSLFFGLCALILTSVLIFAPILKIKFGWIDDGWDTIMVKKIIESFSRLDFNSLSNILIERSLGLFRPVHWLWMVSIYILSGNSSEIQHLLHSILVIMTSLLIYLIIRYYSKSNISAFFASSLFLVVPANIENWVRMGPQEPLMGFLMVLSLCILFRFKKPFLALAILFLAFLTKETVIAVVPAITAYYLVQKFCGEKDSNLLKYLAGSYIITMLVLLVIFSIRTGYATDYVFDVAASFYRFKLILNILETSFPFGIVFLITFFFRNYCPVISKKIKKISQINFVELFFLMLFVSFIAVQSPWIFVLNRYFLPITIPGVIFLGLELSNILKIIHTDFGKAYTVFVVVFLLSYSTFLASNIIKINALATWWTHYTNEIQLMFKYVADNTPRDGKVYINFKKNDSTLEPIAETGWNLGLFYDRNDIQVKSIEDKPLADKDYIVASSPTFLQPSNAFDESVYIKNNNLIKSASLKRTDRYIVFSNVQTIIRQIAKKGLNLVLKHKQMTPDGIYTYYILSDQWNFYYYK